ncbi:kelch repeat and BTB domain-containing protein 12-like [Planococcus citri]|uniref:kelch repeat and BTB domain-containing protein 12-like n=1 Tax=Planococcus citri TaxID=170843 RepID=UPI0031F7D123
MTYTPFEEIKLDARPNGVFDTMDEYRKKNLFCDVTLDIGGTLFPCHRLILTISSTYFQAMFNGNFKESSLKTIPIQGINAEVMEILLSAIYSARIRLLPNNAYFVLKASHLLQCDKVFNACVDCIIKNIRHMHYLPETCAFAKTVGAEKLYGACIGKLATSLIFWGKTDSLLDLSYDVFKHLLSKVRSTWSSIDDDILAIIIKWCKYNNTSAKDINMLLQVPTFSKNPIWTSAVAELMVAARSEDSSHSAYGILSDDGDLSLNLYLNSIDVESGARGWGRLKINESFDKCTLSNFQATDLSFKKFCTIGTKTYCLELNYFTRKFIFSCFEDNVGVDLQVPNDLKCRDGGYYIIAVEKMIYLFHGIFATDIWVYHCELGTWEKIFTEYDSPFLKDSFLSDYHPWFDVTFLDHVIYVVGCKNSNTVTDRDNRYILAIDSRAPYQIRNRITFPNPFQHENAAVCSFDGKIAISGSSHDSTLHNTFSIFDVTANKWRTDLQPMNEGRARHKMIHRDGFIYAVERRPFTKNEKYDVKLNTWIEMPKLPERAQFVSSDGVNITVGLGNVIYAE